MQKILDDYLSSQNIRKIIVILVIVTVPHSHTNHAASADGAINKAISLSKLKKNSYKN